MILLSSALWALPAGAMTASQAECPSQLAPKGLGGLATDQIVKQADDTGDKQSTVEAFRAVIDSCTKREQITGAQTEPYAKYVVARIIYDDMAQRLTKLGVSPALLDRVFGLGQGKLNPGPDEMTDAQFDALSVELAKQGIEFDRLPESVTGLIGGYVAISGELYRNADLIR